MRVIDDTLKELLAVIGERIVNGVLPAVDRSYDKATQQSVFSIPNEPRKIVVDPDGTIGWFNSEGPEA